MVGVPLNQKLISATVHLHNHLCHHCRHKARDSPGVYLLVCLADKRMGIVGSKGDGGGIQQFHRPTRHIDTCLAIGVIYVLFFIPLPFIQLHNRHHHLLLLFPRRTGRPDLPWLDRCACHSCFPPCPSTVGASPYLRLLRVAYWLRPTIIRLRVIWLPAPRIHQASPASPCGCSPRRAPPVEGKSYLSQWSFAKASITCWTSGCASMVANAESTSANLLRSVFCSRRNRSVIVGVTLSDARLWPGVSTSPPPSNIQPSSCCWGRRGG